MSKRMPAIFFGHGNPMNALQTNAYTAAWSSIGARMPHPRAILSVSAHWFVPVTAVTAIDRPRTIHDFGGFPRELYEVQYPAPGDPQLASSVQQLLAPVQVLADEGWGLDHGTWSVLRHVFPKADVPVIQLSIDETRPAAFHYELGRSLRVLRDEGILLMGSGDIVHKLHAYAWGGHPVGPYEWAVRFEAKVRELIVQDEHAPLIDYGSLGSDAMLSADAGALFAIALCSRGRRPRRGDHVSRRRRGRRLGLYARRAGQIALAASCEAATPRVLSSLAPFFALFARRAQLQLPQIACRRRRLQHARCNVVNPT